MEDRCGEVDSGALSALQEWARLGETAQVHQCPATIAKHGRIQRLNRQTPQQGHALRLFAFGEQRLSKGEFQAYVAWVRLALLPQVGDVPRLLLGGRKAQIIDQANTVCWSVA